jgi:hypothetical protein
LAANDLHRHYKVMAKTPRPGNTGNTRLAT